MYYFWCGLLAINAAVLVYNWTNLIKIRKLRKRLEEVLGAK